MTGQVILLGLSLANLLSLYLSSPIVITLALITGYVQYSRVSGEKVRKTFRDLRRHTDDFAKFNFEEGQAGGDYRVILFLDRVTFPSDTREEPWRDIATMIPEIKNVHTVFQSWHSTIKQSLETISQKGISIPKEDFQKWVGEVVTFYNTYLEKVAERILRLLNSVPVLERADEISAMLNVYRENMGHLRERVNTFLADLRESGYSLPVLEVNALQTELIHRWH